MSSKRGMFLFCCFPLFSLILFCKLLLSIWRYLYWRVRPFNFCIICTKIVHVSRDRVSIVKCNPSF
jgi:hypothetical protein